MAGLYVLLFSVGVTLVFIGLLYYSDVIGFEQALLGSFLFSLVVIVVALMAAPVSLIMVIEDQPFTPALMNALRFTRRRFVTYLGVVLLLGLVAVAIGMVHTYASYLGFILSVLSNIAVADLYVQYRVDRAI